MAFYSLSIAAVAKQIAQDWTLQETANGRKILQAGIYSLDGTYRPALNDVVLLAEGVQIASYTIANPTVITTEEPHGIVNQQTVEIYADSGGTPTINGTWTATRISDTTFSIPVNVTSSTTHTNSDGNVQRRIFGGNVAEPDEGGPSGLARTPIITMFGAADFAALAEHRYVDQTIAAGTLKQQITVLTTNYLPDCTVHPDQVNGPAMLEGAYTEFPLLRDVFDAMSTASGGYVWEIDPYQRVRFFLPGSEVCPVNAVTGNNVIRGDVRVKQTREKYANRVILRFSERPHAAYGFFSLSAGNASDGETVTLGKTYMFQTTLTDVDGHVLIGATNEDSLHNLLDAITLGGGAGSTYATSTTENTQATAYAFAAHTLKATALTPGSAGNSISATTTCANGLWFTEGGVGISELALGSDQALVNKIINQNLSFDPTVWEVVESAPEIVDLSAARVLSDQLLATHMETPKTVTYDTLALGIRPGQTQTVTVSERNVNGTFLITDVATRSEARHVRRTVTAIESSLLDTADQWRDTYKQWAGGSSGSGITAMAVGGGGGGGGGGQGGGDVFSDVNVSVDGQVALYAGTTGKHIRPIDTAQYGLANLTAGVMTGVTASPGVLPIGKTDGTWNFSASLTAGRNMSVTPSDGGVTIDADVSNGVLLSSDPASPGDGDYWFVLSGTSPTRSLELRYRDGGVTYAVPLSTQ